MIIKYKEFKLNESYWDFKLTTIQIRDYFNWLRENFFYNYEDVKNKANEFIDECVNIPGDNFSVQKRQNREGYSDCYYAIQLGFNRNYSYESLFNDQCKLILSGEQDLEIIESVHKICGHDRSLNDKMKSIMNNENYRPYYSLDYGQFKINFKDIESELSWSSGPQRYSRYFNKFTKDIFGDKYRCSFSMGNSVAGSTRTSIDVCDLTFKINK